MKQIITPSRQRYVSLGIIPFATAAHDSVMQRDSSNSALGIVLILTAGTLFLGFIVLKGAKTNRQARLALLAKQSKHGESRHRTVASNDEEAVSHDTGGTVLALYEKFKQWVKAGKSKENHNEHAAHPEPSKPLIDFKTFAFGLGLLLALIILGNKRFSQPPAETGKPVAPQTEQTPQPIMHDQVTLSDGEERQLPFTDDRVNVQVHGDYVLTSGPDEKHTVSKTVHDQDNEKIHVGCNTRYMVIKSLPGKTCTVSY